MGRAWASGSTRTRLAGSRHDRAEQFVARVEPKRSTGEIAPGFATLNPGYRGIASTFSGFRH